MERGLSWLAAAAFACWTLYSLMTLVTSGEIWTPASRHSTGASMWRDAGDQPGMTAFLMAIYCAIPAFFAFLAVRKK